MKRLVIYICTVMFLSIVGGCSTNYYNVPRETYEQKVRVIGLAPIMLDAESDIRYPEKPALLALLNDANRKNEPELVNLLKDTGAYFSVRLLEDSPDQLFTKLVSRRERRDDAGIVYNKYLYQPDAIKQLIASQNLDALMLVTISGLSRAEKLYSSNFMSYLEGEYNYLIMTAQIVGKDGDILWEYPNFRRRLLSYPSLLDLQYADFDEAKANMTDEVQVKFKTIPGITRALTKEEKSSLAKDKNVSKLYNTQFESMTALLQPARAVLGGKKEEEKKQEAKPEGK